MVKTLLFFARPVKLIEVNAKVRIWRHREAVAHGAREPPLGVRLALQIRPHAKIAVNAEVVPHMAHLDHRLKVAAKCAHKFLILSANIAIRAGELGDILEIRCVWTHDNWTIHPLICDGV